MSKADTNQASEDESKKPSERKRLFDRLIFMFGWKGETRRNKANKMMKIIDQYTETIIRTEKLKLLAEVRERVVGEDELYATDEAGWGVLASNREKMHANKVKSEQRVKLTKLEAEL